MAEVGDLTYRDNIKKTVRLAGLAVEPKKHIGTVLKALYGNVYVQRGVKTIVDYQQQGQEGGGDDKFDGKVILLAENDCDVNATTLPEELEKKLLALKKPNESSLPFTYKLVSREVELTYKNFTMPEMLTKLLPEKCVALSGFEQVGHIAHVNLSADHIPYQFIIGQVLIDTNSSISIVVNKVESISSVFREFKMEIIGGKNDTSLLNAVVKQHGFLFHVPYDKVYWNSRLSAEHDRLVTKMKKGDQLFDVMAGIGPFALPAAHEGLEVHANDLNPASYEAMKKNAIENGLDKFITAYNLDGREFVDSVVRPKWLEASLPPAGQRRHFAMNLPDLAVTFLDVFTRPSFRTGKIKDQNFLVHVYGFSAAGSEKSVILADAVKQVEANLKCDLPADCIEETHLVRDVAPKKQMFCVSFRVPPSMFQPDESSPEKKLKQ